MKALIIFLLAVRVFAQMPDPPHITLPDTLKDKGMGKSYQGDIFTVPKPTYHYQILDELTQKWIEYKKECYADSTLIERPIY